MKFEGWFVKITTDVGKLEFPFGSTKGYDTKKQAEFVAEECMKHVPGIISAEVYEK